MKKKPRLSEKTAQECYKIEVETEEDLEKVREWLDIPILSYRGQDAVIDVRDKLLYYKPASNGRNESEKL